MHEYSLVSALVDRVEKEARARRAVAVHRLEVRIGALSGVEPELFASAFTLCRQGLLENATLDIRRSEAEWACPACTKPIAREGWPHPETPALPVHPPGHRPRRAP